MMNQQHKEWLTEALAIARKKNILFTPRQVEAFLDMDEDVEVPPMATEEAPTEVCGFEWIARKDARERHEAMSDRPKHFCVGEPEHSGPHVCECGRPATHIQEPMPGASKLHEPKTQQRRTRPTTHLHAINRAAFRCLHCERMVFWRPGMIRHLAGAHGVNNAKDVVDEMRVEEGRVPRVLQEVLAEAARREGTTPEKVTKRTTAQNGEEVLAGLLKLGYVSATVDNGGQVFHTTKKGEEMLSLVHS